jgi:hypothetical protein
MPEPLIDCAKRGSEQVVDFKARAERDQYDQTPRLTTGGQAVEPSCDQRWVECGHCSGRNTCSANQESENDDAGVNPSTRTDERSVALPQGT